MTPTTEDKEYKAILYDLGNVATMEFRFLSQAMRHAAENKVTGYVVTPAHEVINIYKGKRRGFDGKKWVSCAVGY